MMYAKENEFMPDFIERTKRNLELVEKEGGYEITQLINSLIGLLVLPKEDFFADVKDDLISEELLNKLKGCVIYLEKTEKNNLHTIIRHMRNAVAHFRIKIKASKPPMNTQKPQIESIMLWDRRWVCKKNGKDVYKKNFEIEMDIAFLKEFIYEFSDKMAEKIKNTPNKKGANEHA